MIHVRDVRGQYQTTQEPKKENGDKKMKKLLGLVFLVAAALVLYFGSVGWPSLDVNLWSLIPVGLFLYFTLENFLKKDYKASLMCLIITFIIANAIYDLLPISSGLVIGAGVLACVGIGFLFPEKKKKKVVCFPARLFFTDQRNIFGSLSQYLRPVYLGSGYL